MSVVVDCSVAVAWCFADRETAATVELLRAVERAGMVVPAVWPLEVASVVLAGERRGTVDAGQRERFFEVLDALDVEVEPIDSGRVFGETMAHARRHGLTSYDASYLELAMRRGLPLATNDGEIVKAAAVVGVKVLGV